MANLIRHKRGTSNPGSTDFSDTAELLINTADGGLFTKTDGGSVVEIGSGGGGSVGANQADYGLVTNSVSSTADYGVLS